MEHAGCFDSADNFPQITCYFFKSISEYPSKKALESRGENDIIHLHLETMEKAWTLSIYYIITNLCPIPCFTSLLHKKPPNQNLDKTQNIPRGIGQFHRSN